MVQYFKKKKKWDFRLKILIRKFIRFKKFKKIKKLNTRKYLRKFNQHQIQNSSVDLNFLAFQNLKKIFILNKIKFRLNKNTLKKNIREYKKSMKQVFLFKKLKYLYGLCSKKFFIKFKYSVKNLILFFENTFFVLLNKSNFSLSVFESKQLIKNNFILLNLQKSKNYNYSLKIHDLFEINSKYIIKFIYNKIKAFNNIFKKRTYFLRPNPLYTEINYKIFSGILFLKVEIKDCLQQYNFKL